MTFWDFLAIVFINFKFYCVVIFALLGVLIYVIIHPSIVREWNMQITTWIAAIAPKKRKKAFEKRLNCTLSTAQERLKKSIPPLMNKFMPYELKVKWVDENDTLESLIKDKQVVVYVPSYKDEAKQAVSVLHNYCTQGFANKAKKYMSTDSSKASDLIVTQKLAHCAGNHVRDYFDRQYLPDVLKGNEGFANTFDRLKKVDVDGLFVPILINEIDKYANNIEYLGALDSATKTVENFMDFIYKIVTKDQGEKVKLTFSEDQIKIKIILAVAEGNYDIEHHIIQAEKAIKREEVNTIYILATGTKINYAREIARRVYARNTQDVAEPIVTEYKRFSRNSNGSASICYEINLK